MDNFGRCLFGVQIYYSNLNNKKEGSFYQRKPEDAIRITTKTSNEQK